MCSARNSFNSFGFAWVSGIWDLGLTPSPSPFLFFFGKDPLGPTRGAFQCCTCRPKANLLRFVFYFFRFPLRGFAFEPRLKFAEHRRGITPLTFLWVWVCNFLVFECVLFFGIDCASFWRWRLLLIFRGLVWGLGPFCSSVRDGNLAEKKRVSDKASRNRSLWSA